VLGGLSWLMARVVPRGWWRRGQAWEDTSHAAPMSGAA